MKDYRSDRLFTLQSQTTEFAWSIMFGSHLLNNLIRVLGKVLTLMVSVWQPGQGLLNSRYSIVSDSSRNSPSAMVMVS